MAKRAASGKFRVLPAKGRGPRPERRKPRPPQRPPLRISQILAWADEHHRRTGKWPRITSGDVNGAPTENWERIHVALYQGFRGLRPGSGLARLLALHRGLRHARNTPPLTIREILAWSDDHRRRTGRWPHAKSGKVLCAPGESWTSVTTALSVGLRGLAGGDTLTRLLARRRGIRHRLELPRLTIPKILSWADAHRRRFGKWPGQTSGPVYGQPGEKWSAIQASLWQGGRGLPGGESLGHLLATRRGARNAYNVPKLTFKGILKWADEHRARRGEWPTENSGPVLGVPGESWTGIALAMARGTRGLTARCTLSNLLVRYRGHRNVSDLPPLTYDQILAWADEHFDRTGRWPTQYSGPVSVAKGESWQNLQACMIRPGRGLPHATTLAKLLQHRRGVRHRFDPPPLSVAQIRAWAEAHRKRTGRWPHDHSGRVVEEPSENWGSIDKSLRLGRRGLPAGSSLPRLLKNWQGRRQAGSGPRRKRRGS